MSELFDISTISVDPTSDPVWLDQQIERLSGYEIIRKALRGDPVLFEPGQISDRCGISKHEASAIYRDRLVDGIMAKLNANNTAEARAALEKLLNINE